MSTVVQIKRSESSGAIPQPSDILVGELAVNLADRKIYSKNSAGAIVEFGGTSNSFPSDWGSITDPVISLIYDFGSITDTV